MIEQEIKEQIEIIKKKLNSSTELNNSDIMTLLLESILAEENYEQVRK